MSDATASLTQAQSLALTTPSGRVVKAIGYVADRDSQGPVLRARYHAPDLTGADDIDSVLADMAHLCETDALAQRDAAAPSAQRIIVSFSAKPLALSQIDASVVQYFEIYRVENGRCIWELF